MPRMLELLNGLELTRGDIRMDVVHDMGPAPALQLAAATSTLKLGAAAAPPGTRGSPPSRNTSIAPSTVSLLSAGSPST